jgi:hypothetical protein
MSKQYWIDDDEILSSYYDDRETFVVSFDSKFVSVEVSENQVIFKIKPKKENNQ